MTELVSPLVLSQCQVAAEIPTQTSPAEHAHQLRYYNCAHYALPSRSVAAEKDDENMEKKAT